MACEGEERTRTGNKVLTITSGEGVFSSEGELCLKKRGRLRSLLAPEGALSPGRERKNLVRGTVLWGT